MKRYKINILALILAMTFIHVVDGKKVDATTLPINPEMNTFKPADKKKKLTVPKIEIDKTLNFHEANLLFEEQTKKHPLDVLNWEAYSYSPKVEFRIGHTDDEIWIKYYVSENHIKATETKTNGDVYKDSCVEFFMSLDDKHYYNFEFNCIGTKHVAYGQGRESRKKVDPEISKEITINSSLGNQPFEEKSGQHDWELLVVIPSSCFINDDIQSFNQLKATANFYKCGDNTSEPHFLSWNAISTDHPDFHQPVFFGNLYFE